MGIQLTKQQRAKLASGGFVLDENLPSAPGPEKGTWYNPKTGKEFKNLPLDPYSQGQYRRRGWRLGTCPPELKAELERTKVRSDNEQVSEDSTQLRLL